MQVIGFLGAVIGLMCRDIYPLGSELSENRTGLSHWRSRVISCDSMSILEDGGMFLPIACPQAGNQRLVD